MTRIIGDIHLGKNFPYTTTRSSAIFNKLHDEVMEKILDTSQEVTQLGDLFDTFAVSGDTLIKGYNYARRMDYILAGNHDVSNNTEKASSLKLLKDHLGCNVVWGMPSFFTEGKTRFVLVPHQNTQEKFEAALKQASEYATGTYNVLLLHCNFGDRQGAETENYLRRDMAKELLTRFSLIVSGHEHNFNTPMKGVVMLGSILPFSFGEMTDKFAMDYDTETGGYELVKTWSATNYGEGMDTDAAFIKVTGCVDIGEAVEVNKWIADKYKNSDVIAIKNDTVLHRHEKAADAPEKAEDWVETVKGKCSVPQQVLLDEFIGDSV